MSVSIFGCVSQNFTSLVVAANCYKKVHNETLKTLIALI